MKVHVILFISFLGIIISCTQKSDLHPSIDVVNIGQQMENPSEVPIRDFAKSVEIVQLETNDSLLIRDIYNLHLFDNNLLIDGRLFDRFGKFLNQVYRIGEGPGEVTKGTNVIKVKDNKIYVLDFAGKVNVYSPDGKCLETIKSPANFYFEFQPLDNGNFVGFKSNFKGDEKICLEFFDKNRLQATVPYTEQYTSEASWFAPGEGKFFDHNGKLLLKKLLCDTIYQVDTKKHLLVPAYHIDFGKWPSKETLRYSYKSIEELQNRLFTEMPFVSFLGEGSDYLVFTVTFTDMVKQQMMHSTNFYNFQNKSTRSVMLTLSDEDLKILGEDGDPLPDYMKGISNNYFFPQVMSDDGNSLISWRQQTNDQNPAVIIATLK